ncbi:MAG TPA: TIGR03085 family metal-binding protein [Streptosporangiaceae bacterium]|nr:TIGR03085 family metal-binding protein [Streptosporangiaceae bacterium]
MSHAQDERRAICDLLAELGPDKPTLCDGWQTVDLAAHLVLREHRPDAAAGVMGGPLAGYTGKVQARLIDRTPFPQLIELIRTGPPRLSVFGLPGADERLNLVEYFVHHEDVLRAQPGFSPRQVSTELADLLWDRLPLARLMLRRAPVGVELARADATGSAANPSLHNGNGRVRITAKARTPLVTVTGSPAELTLWVMGRTSAAQVHLDGNDSDVAALRSNAWRH